MSNCCNNVVGVNDNGDRSVSIGGDITIVLSGGAPGATGPMPTLSDIVNLLVNLPKRASNEAAVMAGDKIYIAKNHDNAPDGAIMVSTITL